MNSAQDTPQVSLGGWVAPFGDPGITDRSHLPRAFRSVPRPSSPLSAKASTRCPCFALDHRTAVTGDAHHRRAQGQTPKGQTPKGQTPCLPRTERGAAVSHEDTSLGQAARHALPAQGLSASVTSQLSPHPSINRAAVARGGVAQSSPNVAHTPACGAACCTCRRRPHAAHRRRRSAGPVVEVNGVEPMTSCLQSRRSPS